MNELLNREFKRIQGVNGRFSLRAFARRLDVQPAHLSEILKGQRNVGPKLAERILSRLELKAAERRNLLKSVAATQSVKARALFTHSLNHQEFATIAEWQHFALMSLLETIDAPHDARGIADRLNLPEREIKVSLDRLKELGLLELTGKRWTLTGKSLATPDRIRSLALCNAHAEDLRLAHNALFEQQDNERDNSAVTMAIDPTRLPRAVKMIRDFERKLCAYLEGGRKTEVYKFSAHLFRLSKSKTGGNL